MKKIVSILILLIFSLSLPVYAVENSYADEAEAIIAYKISQSGAKSFDEWTEGLAQTAGNGAEWYVIALHQLGKSADLGKYSQELADSLSAKNQKGTNAQRCAMGFLAANCNSIYIEHAVNNTIGSQGIMSYIWGLHLLSNGAKSAEYSPEALAEKIVSFKLSDGGFALSGTASNVDVTAMAVSALAPYYGKNASVKDAIDSSLAFLSSVQAENGGFVNYGAENCESAAQVIIALCALGIDPTADTRFIKNGKSAVDSLRSYAMGDGSFSHISGGGTNESANQQALHAFTALARLESGKSGLFMLDAQADATPSGFRDVSFDKPNNKPEEKSADIKTIVCVCVIAVCAAGIGITLLVPKKKKIE